MNQILSVEMQNNKKKRGHNKASIKSVVTFFCVMLFIFGMSIISVGVFMQIQNGDESGSQSNVATEDKPKIEIVQDVSTLNITVTSQKEISKVVYRWNNEEETQVNGNNQTELPLNINIPLGTNILTISAVDVDGNEQTFEKTYVGVEAYEPAITLGQDGNTIKITFNSESVIDYISYYFDEEEVQTEQITNTTAEISVDAIEGEHSLTILVVNEDGEKYEDTRKIYVPTATVVTDGQNFIINAEDTRGITKVEIDMNGNQQEIEVNDTKYSNTLELQDGENRISVVVYNSDGLSITKRVRFEK